MAGTAVRAVDLDDLGPSAAQVPGQPGAIRAGPLHAERLDRPQVTGPAVQLPVARGGGGRDELVKATSKRVERDGDVLLTSDMPCRSSSPELSFFSVVS